MGYYTILLATIVLATLGTPPGMSSAASSPSDAATDRQEAERSSGVRLKVYVSNAGPNTVVRIHFKNATSAGWIEPESPGGLTDATRWKANFTGGDLSFAVLPQGGIWWPERRVNVTFYAGIVISGPVSGTVEIRGAPAPIASAYPTSVYLSTEFSGSKNFGGASYISGGSFVMETNLPPLPPTCTLGESGCDAADPRGHVCGARPGAKCYHWHWIEDLCCTVPPPED